MSFVGLAGIPFIVALVQLVKNTWPGIPSHFWPAVVLGVAVVLNVALAWQLGLNLGTSVLVGMVTGLSASGLYSWATTSAGVGSPVSGVGLGVGCHVPGVRGRGGAPLSPDTRNPIPDTQSGTRDLTPGSPGGRS